jgi:hypothetical protein
MKTYTDIRTLLEDTNHGQRTVVFPHEMFLKEIRKHHSEIYDGLTGLSLKIPRQGVHLTMAQARDESTYNLLINVLKVTKTEYALLGPKGKPVSPAAAL